MTLYNCKSTAVREVYRITKFTIDLDVESSYLTGPKACECPGYAKRNACRHGAIRALFMTSGHIDDEWLLDYDTREWTRNPAVAALDASVEKIVADELLSPDEIIRGAVEISKSANAIAEGLANERSEESVSGPEDSELSGPELAALAGPSKDFDEALGVGVSATPAPAPAVERKASHSPAAPAGVSPLRKGRRL